MTAYLVCTAFLLPARCLSHRRGRGIEGEKVREVIHAWYPSDGASPLHHLDRMSCGSSGGGCGYRASYSHQPPRTFSRASSRTHLCRPLQRSCRVWFVANASRCCTAECSVDHGQEGSEVFCFGCRFFQCAAQVPAHRSPFCCRLGACPAGRRRGGTFSPHRGRSPGRDLETLLAGKDFTHAIQPSQHLCSCA